MVNCRNIFVVVTKVHKSHDTQNAIAKCIFEKDNAILSSAPRVLEHLE